MTLRTFGLLVFGDLIKGLQGVESSGDDDDDVDDDLALQCRWAAARVHRQRAKKGAKY